MSQGGYVYDSHPVYDYQFYRRIGELSLSGSYPSIDYWLEYPPVFSWTIIGIYRLSLLLPAVRDPIFWFHNFMGVFLGLVEAGNLTLIYLIEAVLVGRAIALRAAWIYALLFWPLFVLLGWLDPLPLFFLLAAVYGLASNRPLLAGLAGGLGFMTKLIPAIVVPAALKAFSSWRSRLVCLASCLLAVVLIAAPFLLASPRMFVAGFQSALSRSSWETIWALLEGYFDVGVVAPLTSHGDPATANWQNHPQSLPWPLITATFAVAYLLVLRRMRRESAVSTVAFAGLAITLMFIFSKGFSSQFIIYLLPFVVLLMPDGRGVAFALLLSVLNLLQFPYYPMLFRSQTWLLWAITGMRTFLWLVFALFCLGKLIDWPAGLQLRLRNRIVPASILLVSLAMGALAWPLLDSFVRDRGEYSDLQQYLRPLSQPEQGVVLSDRDLIGYTYPFLDGSAVYVLPEDWEKRQDVVVTQLRSFAAVRPQVWLLLDYTRGEDARQGFLERTLDSYGPKATNRWFETFRLVGYSAAHPTDKLSAAISEKFGQSLALDGYEIPGVVADGDPMRVKLRWRAVDKPSADYSLFIHVVSKQGAIVAQRDKQPTLQGKPMSSWPAGAELVDTDDVLVPVGVPAGYYEVLVGLYRPQTGERLKLAGGRDALPLGQVEVVLRPAQRTPRLKGSPVEMAKGLRVLGYEVDGRPRANENIRLAIYAQSDSVAGAGLRTTIALQREGAAPTKGALGDPLHIERPGQIVRQALVLDGVPAGRYKVGVRVTDDTAASPSGWIWLPIPLEVE